MAVTLEWDELWAFFNSCEPQRKREMWLGSLQQICTDIISYGSEKTIKEVMSNAPSDVKKLLKYSDKKVTKQVNKRTIPRMEGFDLLLQEMRKR